MVIDNFNIFCAGIRPEKAHPKLLVHANTVLPGAISLQQLESISRWDTEIVKPTRDLQLTELASRDRFDIRKPFDPPAFRKSFRIGTPERDDHEE